MITSNACGLKYPEVPPWQVFHDNPGEGGKFPATNLDPELSACYYSKWAYDTGGF